MWNSQQIGSMVQKTRHKLSFSVVWWTSGTAPRQLFARFRNLNDLHPSRNSPAEAARCQRASCQRLTHLRRFPKFQKRKEIQYTNTLSQCPPRDTHSQNISSVGPATNDRVLLAPHKDQRCFVEPCSATVDSSIRAHFTARKCSVSCYKGIAWYVY